jgi:hypothetical protein
LDKLLADVNKETAPASTSAETPAEENAEPQIDPELAKLLKDLG